MASVNDALFEESVSHAHDLIGYSNGAVRRMLKLLNSADDELFERLQKALDRLPADSYTVKRLEAMLKSVRELNQSAYEQLQKGIEGELQDLTDYELEYQQQTFKSVLPVSVAVASVPTEQVYAAAMSQPFQGRLLREWAASIEAARFQNIKDAVSNGYVQNETIQQIVQRIRGTRSLQYKDGIIDISRRNAETIVRTAVAHTANFARESFYTKNDQLLKGIRLVETLDPRTCINCMTLDGKVFPIKKGPRPPHHFGCRGTSTPVVKSWKELGLNAEEVPASTRASMNGQVPADMNYQQWLTKQTPEMQDKILGVGKAQLFRSGVTVDKFVNRAGVEYSLEQLRQNLPRPVIPAKKIDFIRSPNLSDRERAVETKFYEAIRKNEKLLIDKYRLINGNTIDPDAVKYLNADFRKDLSLAAAVHEPSSYLAKAIFTDALEAKRRSNDLSPTIFTAGGSGSGKSQTMPLALEALQADSKGLIYDSVLSSFKSATQKIDEALGITQGNVAIVYTNTSMEKAFEFNALRDRSVTISTLSKAHIGASGTIKQLSEHYADNPRVLIHVVNNSGKPGGVSSGSLADVPEYDPVDSTKNLAGIAKRLLDEGKISEEKYNLLFQ